MEEKKKKEPKFRKLSTVETRPAVLQIHAVGKNEGYRKDSFIVENGKVKEFKNRSVAKEFFVITYAEKNPDVKATVFVKDEELEFINKQPSLKTTKATKQ